ncbi:hypothetical protein KP77_12330 [Jeotgalibacillus alimentarius]|uniref:Flavodoxin-like domain-containing protein n=1 Tax=Jeotgalibacillus alimentarius TaxID=135826 RepID=A0A0C2W562_9BACL|nr:flavodoxin domain-containing protein [Jeotgalibacillus alimentarius]KIL51721.1 hypothetical protein KP77_12330 [Jeotgalibacillus alimentarius]
MKTLIVYASRTGNTERLANILYEKSLEAGNETDYVEVGDVHVQKLSSYEACIVVTYTWGSGDLPREMIPLFKAFERADLWRLVTGVAGTGDQCYPHYCGAVDRFRDMLHAKTDLAVTLKVELAPQQSDVEKCSLFIDKLIARKRILLSAH